MSANHPHNCRGKTELFTIHVTLTWGEFGSDYFALEWHFFLILNLFSFSLSSSPPLAPSLSHPLLTPGISLPSPCLLPWLRTICADGGHTVNILFLWFVQGGLFGMKTECQLKSLCVKNIMFSLLLPRQIICLSKGFFLDYSSYYWDHVWISQVCVEFHNLTLYSTELVLENIFACAPRDRVLT